MQLAAPFLVFGPGLQYGTSAWLGPRLMPQNAGVFRRALPLAILAGLLESSPAVADDHDGHLHGLLRRRHAPTGPAELKRLADENERRGKKKQKTPTQKRRLDDAA